MRHAAAHQWNAEVGMVLRADHHGHGRVLRKSRERWRVVSCETVVRIWTGRPCLPSWCRILFQAKKTKGMEKKKKQKKQKKKARIGWMTEWAGVEW